MRLIAEALGAEAFAPYGEVVAAPETPGRNYFGGSLANLRPGARPSLAVALLAPLASLPLKVTRMERHEFSSQTFIPLEACRYLVVVAPRSAGGGPDARKARAFLAGPGQGVTYRADTWHHPMSVIGWPARFAILMWRDGSAGDEEFVGLDAPFVVDLR